MTIPRSRTRRPREISSCYLSALFLLFSIAVAPSNSLTFNISASMGCNQTAPGFVCQGDAFSNQGIQLTRNQLQDSITNSVGRAVYSEPVLLWDSSTGKITDFTTHFTFVINALNRSFYGDGLAFFLSPYPSVIPPDSRGGSLGLFNSSTNSNKTANRIVAVEFDSFQNSWDPSPDHVGINVNSIVSNSNVSWNSSIKDGRTANAWVSYSSISHNLSVFLTYANNPVFRGNSSLSWTVDLRQVLPEKVAIGFSAATGSASELHTILSWDFSSTLEETKKSKIGLVVGVVVAVVGALIAGLAFLVWYLCLKKTCGRQGDEEGYDESIDDKFEQGRGPKRFPYRELVSATKNFTEDWKLGEGGFGSVYKGLLNDLKLEVAIKRVSRDSSQGKKEYISEVQTISRLRHRNLVQLIGWCHERADFLLVYEYMPHGSLDTHLYGKKALLAWPERYKIALGLASALLYLHQEWEQCVVHRDIKPSNVMLDSGFNAKLGDFGLARFVDHDQGSQTTILAGTMGYLAPECLTTGKASKESDVYSFGIVALEIACGRRPVEPREKTGKVGLVEWVWGLYGDMMLVNAADERLSLEFEGQQMERLMVVGLWCAHPDYNLRPTIRQAMAVLNFEGPMPNLPSKMPVPTYFAPPMGIGMFPSYTVSSSQTSTCSNHMSGGYPTTASDSSTVSDESSPAMHLLRTSKK